MLVKSEHVERAVAEVSAGAGRSEHVAEVVGGFMRRQPMIGHYVQAHRTELGSVEGVVLALLHAHVVARCVEVARGRVLRPVSAADLDAAAKAGRPALASTEPELDGYLEGNVVKDDPTLGKVRDQALSLLRLVARAILDQLGGT